MLKAKLDTIKSAALESFSTASSTHALQELKAKYFGKQGELSLLMRDLAQVSKEEKPAMGKLINEVKVELEAALEQKEQSLKAQELEEKLLSQQVDLTLPGPQGAAGAKHPLTMVIQEIVAILGRIGFSVRQGPFIESDKYNFEFLNIPAHHPARDMQDTFYIDEKHVLRTHTSPVQIRTMLSERPPIRVIAPGGVFRKDSDATHSPNFHQIECLLVDENVSMADLKGAVAFFVREYFGQDIKTRFRPSYFPFTEPSAEVDCQCPVCKGKGCRVCKSTGWIEIGGCGLVNPNVFAAVGIEHPRWQGFAFGFGVERMAMIKYGIDDIRYFSDNDLRFLQQFRV